MSGTKKDEPMANRAVMPALRYPRRVASPTALKKNTSGGSPLEVLAFALLGAYARRPRDPL